MSEASTGIIVCFRYNTSHEAHTQVYQSKHTVHLFSGRYMFRHKLTSHFLGTKNHMRHTQVYQSNTHTKHLLEAHTIFWGLVFSMSHYSKCLLGVGVSDVPLLPRFFWGWCLPCPITPNVLLGLVSVMSHYSQGVFGVGVSGVPLLPMFFWGWCLRCPITPNAFLGLMSVMSHYSQ